jgi:DNA repair protein RecN (Recombination protein N)
MLALKSLIGKKMQMPTLIFDEIDTGISGETAVRVGEMMKDLSQNTQLIVVSHLPQIAAGADVHFEIFKNETGDKTISGVRKLSPEERVETLATMLSGKKDSDKARLTAKEMLGTE